MLPLNITRDAIPPFHQLDEYTFQRLCRDLLADEPRIISSEIYGERGERQLGIDVLARRSDGLLEVGQCKRYKRYTSRDIKDASAEFLNHLTHWRRRKVCRFILFVACELSSSPVQEQIADEVEKFEKYGIKYEAWSATQIAKRLRYHPSIVARYFTPADYWLNILCSPRGNIRAEYAPLTFSNLGSAALKMRRHPDVLTPGVEPSLFIKSFAGIVGDELAGRIYVDRVQAISAVERGDFGGYTPIAISLADHGIRVSSVQGAAAYFAAEGVRLQADVSPDRDQAILLYSEALEKFRETLEIAPNNPRALRGLAATLAKLEDYDESLRVLNRAEGLVLAELSQQLPTSHVLDLIHERLRISRHKVDLLLAIRDASPLNVWNRESRRPELEGYAAQSQNLHEELMPFFASQKQWWRFEWFAASMFLSKSWHALGHVPKWHHNLLQGLQFRAAMLDRRPLTNIERDNLRWWCQIATRGVAPNSYTASGLTRDMLRALRKGVENLSASLAGDDGATTIDRIETILVQKSSSNFENVSPDPEP